MSAAMDMKVVLGSHTAKAFVVAPKDFDVIGIVRIGMEFGLLAKSNNGNYFRVNGSQSTLLNRHDVEEAIYRAKHCGRGEPYSVSRVTEHAAKSRPGPVILLKKHRKINPEIAANSQLQPLAA